ncbi:protein of unknown function [Agreia sp. COWG]|nr:protein of unknown function [Agreia sp. COWG]
MSGPQTRSLGTRLPRQKRRQASLRGGRSPSIEVFVQLGREDVERRDEIKELDVITNDVEPNRAVLPIHHSRLGGGGTNILE